MTRGKYEEHLEFYKPHLILFVQRHILLLIVSFLGYRHQQLIHRHYIPGNGPTYSPEGCFINPNPITLELYRVYFDVFR